MYVMLRLRLVAFCRFLFVQYLDAFRRYACPQSVWLNDSASQHYSPGSDYRPFTYDCIVQYS